MNHMDHSPITQTGCCPAAGLASIAIEAQSSAAKILTDAPPVTDPSSYVVHGDDDLDRLHLFVEGIHCAGCIQAIEGAVATVPGVATVRLNMSTRRLFLAWERNAIQPVDLLGRISALGYGLTPFDPAIVAQHDESQARTLLTAMAVAGFAAANVMLLSVAVWAGADWDMGPATRGFFHWISALIALPAIAYAGQPFFRAALDALSHRRLNMDVPISLAVILAAAMSLYQTVQGGAHAYFDAAVTLLFFLLVGRYLDGQARARARAAAENLVAMTMVPARVIDADGIEHSMPIGQVPVGAMVVVSAGGRIPVDGTVVDGASDIDTALVTGETVPRAVQAGANVYAGTLNLTGPVTVRSLAKADSSVLSEIVRSMEAAEQRQAKYVRLADRAAQFYAPAVHLLGFLTLIGWMTFTDAGWEAALMAAIAVLIITCPCALALAVPAVQVCASGLLMRRGILLKSPDGLERIARIDTVVFDKTGTLTNGQPALRTDKSCDETALREAARLARHSRHPLSQALARAAGSDQDAALTNVTEVPGFGLRGCIDGREARLGHREWCDVAGPDTETDTNDGDMELWFALQEEQPVRFAFTDSLLSDAADTVRALKAMNIEVELLSGDRQPAVRRAAGALGIENWHAETRPDGKVAHLNELKAAGHRVLMVGDGINDAPALAAGFASMSPADASEIAQTAADVVIQGRRRMTVVDAIRTARTADRLVKQNFALALLYNAMAIPLAIFGLATPLVAAVAMSTSSVLVSLNALRLRWLVPGER